MTEGIEAITARALTLALDAANLRQQAIATNIANANTAGYVPVHLNFETQLEEARRSMQERGTIAPAALAQVRPYLEAASMSSDEVGASSVQLDAEVAHMAENAIHFQALAKGLSRHYAILSLAVSDGKK